jgi:uncharacterized spore protein YtfJ
MATDFNVNENITNLFEKLEKFLTSKTVIGEPIVIGETTLIPVICVAFGLGSGGGDGTMMKGNKGMGSGAGMGAKIAPIAIIVIKGEKVELLPVKKNMGLEKLVDMMPEMMDKMKTHMKDKKEDECCSEKK